MKLWDVVATCLLLLSSVAAARPLYQSARPAKRTFYPGGYSDAAAALSAEDQESSFQRGGEEEEEEERRDLQQRNLQQRNLQRLSVEDAYDATGPYPEQFDDVMDFIEATIGRLRRSSEPRGGGGSSRAQRRAANTGAGKGHSSGGSSERRRSRGRAGGRGGKGGRGGSEKTRLSVQTRGCLLKEVHLNVTDLGLGYQTKEELIFRYCSGPCAEAETNYDKILNNLTHNRKLNKDTPSRTCCRPIAFDDDLSFLDDNVVYHTLKKHSARKCACV